MRTLKFTRKLGRIALVLLAPVAFSSSVYAQDAAPSASPEPAAVLEPKPAPEAAVESTTPGIADSNKVMVPEGGVGAGEPAVAEVPYDAQSGEPNKGTLTLSMSQLVGKTVIDAQGKKVGIVTNVKKEQGGTVRALHVQTDGLFGFFSKTLLVPADAISETRKSVKLKLASADVGKLSVIKPKS